MTKNTFILVSIYSVLIFTPFCVHAFPQRASDVQIITIQTNKVNDSWIAFDESYQGGSAVAVGDVIGDSIEEVIIAQSGGTSARGMIRIFDTKRRLVNEFFAFPEGTYASEMSIAVGDVDADGKAEIVVSQPEGHSSLVHIYNGKGQLDIDTVKAFEAFPGSVSGASVAVGNVAGDAAAEIIAASGKGTAPRVRILNAQAKSILPDMVPFAESDVFGITVTTANTSGGLYDDLVLGFLNGGETWVKIYRIDEQHTYPVLAEFRPWSREFASGVSLAAIDVDRNGTEEIAVAPAGDQRAEIRFFQADGAPVNRESIFPYEEDFRGGVSLATVTHESTDFHQILVMPRQQKQRGDQNRPHKYIEVNLSEQIAYLWENAYLRNVYLISSGLPRTPSPEGEWSVLAKLPVHVYDGRPVYYFPNTKWNLRYKAGGPERNYYLHTAYWHNNFGNPMSHGCINMREADAHFTYDWSEIGTPVWIHQ